MESFSGLVRAAVVAAGLGASLSACAVYEPAPYPAAPTTYYPAPSYYAPPPSFSFSYSDRSGPRHHHHPRWRDHDWR